MIKQLVIHTAARGHGKGILRADCPKTNRLACAVPKEYLSERRDLAEMAVRHARPEQIGPERCRYRGWPGRCPGCIRRNPYTA